MMQNLKTLLKNNSKHGFYQMLPPALIEMDEEYKNYSFSDRLDEERYKWMTSKIDFTNKKVLDIGGNIGYFSLRLAKEFNARVTLLEPTKAHCLAARAIANKLDLDSEQFKIQERGLLLDEIDNLENYDVILFYNVIQHAGDDFAKDEVKTIEDWQNYAISYLSKLRKKTNKIVFQMGYSWKGFDRNLCLNRDIINYSKNLLGKSGFDIVNCGIVAKISNEFYSDYKFDGIDNFHPIFSLDNRVLAKIQRVIFRKSTNYRFKQRPIFICS